MWKSPVGVVLLLAAVAGAMCAPASSEPAAPPGDPASTHSETVSQPAGSPENAAPPKDPVAQCLQDGLNALRSSHGLAPLPEIPSLLSVAQRHSDLMAAEQSMRHSTDAVFDLLPRGWHTYGENVVFGKSCEGMFEAFLGSEPHRAAMLRDFDFSGTAVAVGGDGWIYATQVFLALPDEIIASLPAASPIPPPPAAPPPLPPAPAPAVPAPPTAAPLPVPEPAPPAVPTISLGEIDPRDRTVGAVVIISPGAAPAQTSLREVDRTGAEFTLERNAGKLALITVLLEPERLDPGIDPSPTTQIIFELGSPGREHNPQPRPSGMA